VRAAREQSRAVFVFYNESMTLASGIEIPSAELARICLSFEVQSLEVFGSAVRGEMTFDSDIDLLVEFVPGAKVGLFRFAQLEQELTKLLGRRVDLVLRRGLKPWVKERAIQEALSIYAG
jgi:predicted nucleotidyltransferase